MIEIDTNAAYTTPRPDVSALVPSSARLLLDVGCSNGSLGASLKKSIPGLNVTGIEISEVFAADAQERLDKVICTDLNTFDWSTLEAQERFDCIVFADVLEHLADPHHHLLCAQYLLKQGGCVIVSLPNIRHISALRSIFLSGTFPRRDRGIFDRTHRHWFTHRDAASLFSQLNLEIERSIFSLRIGDRGGGRVNRWLNRLPEPVKSIGFFREFLTYQFCFKATRRAGSEP